MLGERSHVTPAIAPSATRYKTLLVHVEASAESDARLQIAVDFAGGLSAKVIGVGGLAQMQMDGVVGIDWQIVADAQQADIKAAEEHFKRIAGVMGQAAAWLQGLGVPDDMMAECAAGADLIIASANHGPHDSTVDPGALALAAGIPVLTLPTGCQSLRGKRITVGWKNTRETRRAITDALPLLCEAEAVLLVAIEVNDEAPPDGLASVLDRLGRHGVAVESRTVREGTDDPVGCLLDCADDAGSDLIVSGAYGHTRLQEWCFGGVTAGLLERSTLPVLFSH
jgi:nucleotide-binding universal stress UspA family protein